MTSRWARFIRGQIVAVLATFVAAFSHGIADGAHPPVVAMVLALAFAGVACVLLASVRLSRTRLAASVTVSQLVYHGLFSLFGQASTPGGAVTSAHHGTVVFIPGAPDQVALVSPADQWMLAAHVGAAALTFVMLLRGEQSLAALVSFAVMLVAALAWRLAQDPTRPLPPLVPSDGRARLPHRLRVLVSSLRHRGPPLRGRLA
jgi:cytosine/uracil/thiamine/allantoin permease